MNTPAVADLLAAYNSQLRDRIPERLPLGVHVDREGPLVRFSGRKDRGLVVYQDLGGLDGGELDALIARQVAFFAARGDRFEWKLHGHDLPADLPNRLREAGFRSDDEETVLIAPVAQVAGPPVLAAGVALREVTERADFDRIAAMEAEVWQEELSGLAVTLEGERAADPRAIAVVVAEAAGEVVSAAWIRFEGGTEFGTLWGGATLPAWRGRGIYRATVAHRANLAAERGYRFLETDASDDSRPILERLGFVPVTTTTPFIWSPPA